MACPMILERDAKIVLMEHVASRLINEAEPALVEYENHLGREWVTVRGTSLKRQYIDMDEAEIGYLIEGFVKKALTSFYRCYRFEVNGYCDQFHDGTVKVRCVMEALND